MSRAASVRPGDVEDEHVSLYQSCLMSRAASVRPGDGEDEPVSLYHYSLAEWFTQTKFCGPVYECKPGIRP